LSVTYRAKVQPGWRIFEVLNITHDFTLRQQGQPAQARWRLVYPKIVLMGFELDTGRWAAHQFYPVTFSIIELMRMSPEQATYMIMLIQD